MLNSTESPELVFQDTPETPVDEPIYAKPFKGNDWFYQKTKKTRQMMHQKGIITFPFAFGYKISPNLERYGKTISPPMGWNKATESINPDTMKPHNYSILTGKINNLYVLDYDLPKEGEEDGITWLKSIFPENHKFWNTYRVKSGSGGQHFYFKYNENLKVSRTRTIYINGVKSKISLDSRSDGGFIIAENSINEVGAYEKLYGDISNLEEIPEELLTFLNPPKSSINRLIKNQKKINMTNNSGDNADVSEDKLKYLALLDGEEHLFENYDQWFFLAKLCANHYNFNLFHQISMKAPGYVDITSCREKFENAKAHTLHFGAFINFLKDNLQTKYDENFGYINKYIYKGDDEGFNQLLFHTYKDKYKYDPDNELWYECCNGIWKKRDKKNLVFRRLIAEEFIDIFKKRDVFLSNLIANTSETDDTLIESLTTKRKIIEKQSKWCRSNNKRAAFITSNADMFCDYDFLKKFK